MNQTSSSEGIFYFPQQRSHKFNPPESWFPHNIVKIHTILSYVFRSYNFIYQEERRWGVSSITARCGKRWEIRVLRSIACWNQASTIRHSTHSKKTKTSRFWRWRKSAEFSTALPMMSWNSKNRLSDFYQRIQQSVFCFYIFPGDAEKGFPHRIFILLVPTFRVIWPLVQNILTFSVSIFRMRKKRIKGGVASATPPS